MMAALVVQNEYDAQARMTAVTLIGKPLLGAPIPLVDDGKNHEVFVRRVP